MKKLLLALPLLLITSQSYATELMGGTLKSFNKTEVGFSCNLYDEDNQCKSVDIVSRKNKEKDFKVVNTLETFDENQLEASALKKARGERYRRYTIAVAGGTAVSTLSCLYEGNIAGCLLIPVGIAFDVVKAKAVLIGVAGFETISQVNRGRFKRHIKYMLNPKKIGKTKRVTNLTNETILSGTRDWL